MGWVFQQTPLDEKSSNFIQDLAYQVAAATEELDEVIKQCAPSWPISQMPAVDRNILRIAIYEMKISQEVSIQVAINEAVELGKRFGGEGTSRFVNGVLGAVAADIIRDGLVKK